MDQEPTLNEAALEIARNAIEEALLKRRNSRICTPAAGNGFVIRERDGEASSIIRLDTASGLRIGIKAYLKAAALEPDFQKKAVESVQSADEARELAKDWQRWQSDQSMSWGTLADWQGYFAQLTEKFPELKEEFRENGIC